MPTSGVRRQFWVKAEATYDTQQAIAATDAVDLVDMQFTPEKVLTEINSHVGTGSYQGEVEGQTGGKWTATCDFMPTTAGTAPDIGPALKAAFGDETIVGGTSVTYDFNDSDTVQTLQLVIYGGDEFYEVVTGAWVEQLTIDAVQNQVPRMTFSGGFAGYGNLRGAPSTTGSNASAATTINMATGDGYKLANVGAGAYIKFGSEDNGGAGYKVTSVTASTIVITPGLANTVGVATAVTPLVPSQTLVGTRISAGIEHAMTIDAVSMGFVSAKYTIATGIKALDRAASSSRPTRVFRTGGRIVDAELDTYFLDEMSEILGAAHASTQVLRDVAVRLGPNTAASRAILNTDKTLFKVQPIALPDAEVAMAKLIGRARQNSAANDEFSLVFS